MLKERVSQLAKRALPFRCKRALRERYARLSITRRFGPTRVEHTASDGIVTCVVKNGEFYMKSFIEHHFELGFRHIFFLDNGSTDRTVDIAATYPNVTMFRSPLRIEAHQGIFKRYLAQKCAGRGWCLDADIDEFFQYPFSDVITLQEFFEYLNAHGYNAVITQMLDMFSDGPIRLSAEQADRDVKSAYRRYDISDITRCPYRDAALAQSHGSRNEIGDDRAALYFGGIRRTLFGHECLLTKHSLVVPSKVPHLFEHVHFVDGARLADLSCVILHYKLGSNAAEQAQQNETGFPGNYALYADTLSFFTRHCGSTIGLPGASWLQHTNELLENSFLFASDAYRNYCRSKQKGTNASRPDGRSASLLFPSGV